MPDPTRLPISACILAHNEETSLPRCIGSVSFCREAIVCDTGSTDDTRRIAAQAGARLLETSWEGFSETRRKLFRAATQPWILWIDADEVVDSNLSVAIIRQFAAPPSVDGFELNRQVVFQNRRIRHGDWFPDWNLRLFRADQWQMDFRLVHESISVPGPVDRLEGLLDHHSFHDWNDLHVRSDRYADLWARTHQDRKNAPSPIAPLLHASWRWFRGYILRRGFLDGQTGWRIAAANARETDLKYRRLRQILTSQ